MIWQILGTYLFSHHSAFTTLSLHHFATFAASPPLLLYHLYHFHLCHFTTLLLHHLCRFTTFATSPPLPLHHLCHFTTTSPSLCHHFNATSTPLHHHFNATSALLQCHFNTTSPPLCHHFATTSPPLQYNIYTTIFAPSTFSLFLMQEWLISFELLRYLTRGTTCHVSIKSSNKGVQWEGIIFKLCNIVIGHVVAFKVPAGVQ
jgi:hypothetical protein